MNRRTFLKIGTAAGSTLVAGRASAEENGDSEEFVGVLVDTTRCIGCRACERACSVEHDLPVPDIENDGALGSGAHHQRDAMDGGEPLRHLEGRGLRQEAVHALRAARLRRGLPDQRHVEDAHGPGDLARRQVHGLPLLHGLVSLRYPQVRIPFVESEDPEVLTVLRAPAAGPGTGLRRAPVRPTRSLSARKRDLMEIARLRIYHHPDRYVHKIYGESEVGGTGWLYLSAVPFEEIGFRTDLGTTPYPEYTRNFLYGVPLVLFGLPALQFGLHLLSDKKDDALEATES